MAKIYINGNCFTVEGALSMRNGKWFDGAGCEIDMNNLEGMQQAKTINITIEGGIDRLDVDHCDSIVVNGDCKKVKTTSGDIKCHDIDGDAESVSGDIGCNIIHGDARSVSGDIRCSEIKGKAGTTTGRVNGKRSSTSYGAGRGDVVTGYDFCSRNSNVITDNEVISGGFTMTRTADGKKHMRLHKDCTVNGRRIGDMSDSELQTWIESMARRNKIVTII